MCIMRPDQQEGNAWRREDILGISFEFPHHHLRALSTDTSFSSDMPPQNSRIFKFPITTLNLPPNHRGTRGSIADKRQFFRASRSPEFHPKYPHPSADPRELVIEKRDEILRRRRNGGRLNELSRDESYHLTVND